MDEQLTSIYLNIRNKYGASVDDVLESPDLRHEFLESAWQVLPAVPERDLLHRLVYLRKKAKLRPAKTR